MFKVKASAVHGAVIIAFSTLVNWCQPWLWTLAFLLWIINLSLLSHL